MTEDYKENLVKYLTGNLSVETGDNIPLFPQQTENINQTVVDNIKNILTTEEQAQNIIILGKIYNEMYSSYLVYGIYNNSNDNYYGFIYLIDDNLDTIQMITEFSSGTKLFPITALNQDENNNMYGLSFNINQQPYVSKVLLFNNIFASGQISGIYKAVLRNDYIVPYNYNQTPYSQNRIIKSPDGATYYIVLNDSGQTKIIKFVINVGAENEWSEVTIPVVFSGRFDVKLDKSSGEEKLNFYGMSAETPSIYYEYSINGDTATLNNTIQLEYGINNTTSQVFAKDIDNIYLYASYGSVGENVIYKVNGNGLIDIYQSQSIMGDSGYFLNYITIMGINGGVFFYERYINATSSYTLSIGFIKEDNTYIKQQIGSYTGQYPITPLYSYIADLFYKKAFNLITFYVSFYETNSYTKKIALDYNSTNYNGEAYSNTNLLSPNKATLYNNNGGMIFARNLYNKTVLGATTTSTVQIPNTMLNDVTISQSDLISETNITLTEDTTDITKNIYEVVNINFSNSISIKNENDPNNIILNPTAAARLNGGTTQNNNYDNVKATKVRINYTDGTNITIALNPEMQILALTDTTYQYNFILQISKQVNNLQIISNDETTVYQTIDTLNLQAGKTYNILQEVEIQ